MARRGISTYFLKSSFAKTEGNTLIEMALVLTFLGITLFVAYKSFHSSAEQTLSVDKEIIDEVQVLDSGTP